MVKKEKLIKIFSPLLERGYTVNNDLGIFEVVNEIGDIVYSGASPRNEFFAKELFKHLKITFDIYQKLFIEKEIL